ncbi:MAG: CCA tRNA nucleotidyltransferase [Clostridium sp.]|nr:CCA tRNA nucleotidyltransferase [Clostridium sp.]
MKLLLPKNVEYIIKTLNDNNYSAYAVGGCIRDSILKKQPNDWDITTSAYPEDIIKLFDKTFKTGLKHGTVTVLVNNELYEITTFRIDGTYSDNRHPDDVSFTSSLFDDLKRRDFTMNSLAYNYKDGLIDPFNGKSDIENKILKCVGDPDQRFNEDALRLMRAVRFSCQHNFKIEDNTLSSICKNCDLIKNISVERIREEFSKILLSEKPSRGIRALQTTGLLEFIMPELNSCIGFNQMNPYHDKDVFEHIMKVLDNCNYSLISRLAGLLHDIGKPLCFSIDKNNIGHFYNHNQVSSVIAKKILTRLKYDNNTIKIVCILVKEHMVVANQMKDPALKRFMARVGTQNLPELYNLLSADLKGHKPPYDFSRITRLKKSIQNIIDKKEPFSLKQLAVNGNDLINIGYKKDPSLGNELKELLDIVIKNPALNTKSSLLKIALDKLNNSPI